MTRREFLGMFVPRETNALIVHKTALAYPTMAGQLLIELNGKTLPFTGIHPFKGLAIEDTVPGQDCYYFEVRR